MSNIGTIFFILIITSRGGGGYFNCGKMSCKIKFNKKKLIYFKLLYSIKGYFLPFPYYFFYKVFFFFFLYYTCVCLLNLFLQDFIVIIRVNKVRKRYSLSTWPGFLFNVAAFNHFNALNWEQKVQSMLGEDANIMVEQLIGE